MADSNYWKSLITRFNATNHPVGDPKLDALGSLNRWQGIDWRQRAIENGLYYSSKSISTQTVGETAYGVVQTGSKPIRILQIQYQINFGQIADGEFTLKTEFYAKDSNNSNYTFTGGTPIQRGRQLNTGNINEQAETVLIDSPVVELTGVSDFITAYVTYFRDSSGNRENVSGVETTFFDRGRYLLIPPYSEGLFVRTATGTAGNSCEIFTIYDYTEGDIYV
jgi:hypothetical protein